MRIVTWNLHGASEGSPAWEVLLDLRPDVALLQEVTGMPERVGQTFAVLSRRAICKSGKPQRFSTAVLVAGRIIEECVLCSECEWVNRGLDFFNGNLITCTARLNNGVSFKVISVYSPAWPVHPERLRGVDVSEVKTKTNPPLWCTDILWSALKHNILRNDTWVVGGDFNTSETFDVDWQGRNNKVYGIRSSGNAETLERMHRLGLSECLRKYNNDQIVPTFRHPRGGVDHQLDHLFVSGCLYANLEKCSVEDAKVIFGQSLSDHLPIVADFNDNSITEIHEAQFRQVASRHDYRFAREAPTPKAPVPAPVLNKKVESTNRESVFHEVGYKGDVDAYSDPTPIATAEQFKAALLTLRNSKAGMAMLQAQYRATNHTISAAQLAKELGYDGHATVNLRYGTLAHRVAEALHYQPGPFPDGKPHWWYTLSYWNDSTQAEEGQDQWIMRPELAQALQELKWV